MDPEVLPEQREVQENETVPQGELREARVKEGNAPQRIGMSMIYNEEDPLLTPSATRGLVQWLLTLLKLDRRWRGVSCVREDGTRRQVTFSSVPQCSRIRLRLPNTDLLTRNSTLLKRFKGEAWFSPSVYITATRKSLEDSPWTLNTESEESLRRFAKRVKDTEAPLVYMEDAEIAPGVIIPLIVSELKAGELSERLRALSTADGVEGEEKLSRSFTLRQGHANPALTKDKRRFDLHIPMLVVGTDSGKRAYYACKTGYMKVSAAPFDAGSEALAKHGPYIEEGARPPRGGVYRLFTRQDLGGLYDEIIDQFVDVVHRLGKGTAKDMKMRRPNDWPHERGMPGDNFMSLCEVRCIYDLDRALLSVNRIDATPELKPPDVARACGDCTPLYMRDVYELGLLAFTQGTVGVEPLPSSQFTLAYRLEP